jgi:hypothetical protein
MGLKLLTRPTQAQRLERRLHRLDRDIDAARRLLVDRCSDLYDLGETPPHVVSRTRFYQDYIDRLCARRARLLAFTVTL